MSLQWVSYLLITSLGFALGASIVGVRRLLTIRHFAGVYFAVSITTYTLRPLIAYTLDDTAYMEASFGPGYIDLPLVGIAVATATIFYALGYRYLAPVDSDAEQASLGMCLLIPSRSKTPHIMPIAKLDERLRGPLKDSSAYVGYIAVLMIVLGYASFAFAQRGFIYMRPNTTAYQVFAGGSVYANTTGYVELANLFVVSGSILLFANTGRMWRTLIIATPWILNQYYYGYARYMILTLLLGLFVVGVMSAHRVKRLRLLLFGILIVIAVLSIVSMRGYRNFWSNGDTIVDAFKVTRNMPAAQALGDFSGFEGAVYVVNNMKIIEPWYGTRIIYHVAILPIPRILWSNKPLPPEFTWDYILGGSSRSISATWRTLLSRDPWYTSKVKGSVGSALEEWGWAGLVINFLLTGLFFAWVERRFYQSDRSAPWVAIFATSYSMNLMLGRNTVFDYTVVYCLIFYFPFLAALWVQKHFNTRASYSQSNAYT